MFMYTSVRVAQSYICITRRFTSLRDSLRSIYSTLCGAAIRSCGNFISFPSSFGPPRNNQYPARSFRHSYNHLRPWLVRHHFACSYDMNPSHLSTLSGGIDSFDRGKHDLLILYLTRARIRSRHDRDHAIRLANQLTGGATSVKISIDDSLKAGGFAAAGELLLSLIAFNSMFYLLLASAASPSRGGVFAAAHRRTERRSTMLFALGCWVFAICWTIGAAAALTDFGVNRSAKVWLDGKLLDSAGLK